MTLRTVLILLVLAVVGVGAAVYGIGSRTNVQTTDFEGERLFPGLLEKASSVSEVEIIQSGNKLTFERKDNRWVLRESDGYPIHTNLITKVILSISSMELLEAKTAMEKRLPTLNLGDPSDPDSNSQRVILKDAEGDVLADIVVGSANYFLPETTTGGMYVRRPDEMQSYLVRGLVDIGEEPRNWLIRDIVDIQADDVVRAEVNQPNGDTLIVVPEQGVTGDFSFANLPEGTKLKSEFAPRNIAALVSGFVLNDVRRSADTPLDDDEAYIANFIINTGMTIEMRIWRVADKQYLRISADAGTAAPDSDAAKLAAEINARAEGWTYIIPEYQYEQISKTFADVTEPIEGS